MSRINKDPLNSLVKLVYIILAIVLVIFVLPRAVSCLLPFLIAWIISLIIKPVADLFQKFRINRTISVIVSMLLVLAVICMVIYSLSAVVIREIRTFTEMFSNLRDGIPVFVWDFIDVLPEAFRSKAAEIASDTFADFGELILPALKTALPKLGGAAGKLPGAFVFTVILLMAIYFMSTDNGSLKEEITKFLPDEKVNSLRNTRSVLKKAFGGYVKAQLIIMCVVFGILVTGFWIMGVELALLLALAISLLDAIPVLGTGMILNPWAVVCLLQGDYARAIGLVTLYGVVLLVRHFLEPRVLSGQLGIHPIITLASMYTGLKLIGVTGMIIGPLIVLIVINYLKMKKEG